MRAISAGLGAVLLLGTVMAAAAFAGNLYALDMCAYVPNPGATHLMAEVFKGKDPNLTELKGVSECDFDGTTVTNLTFDDVCKIVDVYVENGTLVVCFETDGFKDDGTFENDTYFQVTTDVGAYGTKMHTSCSKPIFTGRPYNLDPEGDIFVIDGDGVCIQDWSECPPGVDKLRWLGGQFFVPCDVPADVTLNFYKKGDDLVGTSTATVTAMGLTDVDCDFLTCILAGGMVGDDLVVEFMMWGNKDDGKFDSSSRFELVVDGCGTFYIDQHTSCSQTIHMHQYLPLMPEGEIIYLFSCGEEGCFDGESPVEDSTWGTIKALYR